MAFCGNCGAQLKGNERFCAACGADVSAATAPVSASQPGFATAPPVPPAPFVAAGIPPTAPSAAAANAAAAGIPLPVPMPQPPAKSSGMKWGIIAVVVLAALGYYYSQHKPATAANSPSAPAQPGQPAQPTAQTQPQDQGTLLQQQNFSGHWQAIYGFVELTNTSWTNHASIAMQSATLECDQYASNGAKLSQMQMKLNGPLAPGGTATFNPFQMGSVSTYMTRVNCAIVAVVPAS